MEEKNYTEESEELEEDIDEESEDGTEDADGEEQSDDENPFASIEDEEDEDDEEELDDESSEEENSEGEEQTDEGQASNNESEFERETKALLKKLGMKDGEDPLAAVKRLKDEADGIDPETRAAKNEWEKQAALDIEAIHKAFPETEKYKSLAELPHKMKFARLMDDPDAGLTVVEAFAASHPEIVAAHVAGSKHASSLRGTKDHKTSVVPRGAGGENTISDKEIRALKRDFPDMTEKEIRKLYRKING